MVQNVILCEFAKNDSMLVKVRDHWQYIEYRDAAHLGCDLRYKDNSYFLVIGHNSSGYDNHLIISKIAEKAQLIECNFLCTG